MADSELGSGLRRASLAQGLSQQDIAEKVDVTSTTISNWERGRGKPKGTALRRLKAILGNFNPTKSSKAGEGNPVLSAFGAWLRRAREAAGMSVPELAATADVTPVAIYHLESGVSQNPQERTRAKLEQALKRKVPTEVTREAAGDQSIVGLGPLTDFDPHTKEDWPTCAGVYVFYDVSDRPIYVGKGANIALRVAHHYPKFWYRYPIVSHAAYVEIKDEKLRHQVEQVLIRFLKSGASVFCVGSRRLSKWMRKACTQGFWGSTPLGA